MPYQGRQPGVGVRDRFIFTATTGQTSFSGNDSNGLPLKYDDAAYVDVFINGTLLVPVTDYTATTKTSVVLIDAAAANDVLEILAYGISSIADTVSASSGGTFAADVTITGQMVSTTAVVQGALTVDGNIESGAILKIAGLADSANNYGAIENSNTALDIYASSNSGVDKPINFYYSNTGTSKSLEVLASGDVEVTKGNLVVGTAGKGIDFSITGGPTAGSGTSELFDDYEEGTWTPTIFGTDTAGTYSLESARTGGTYTKIGRTVYVNAVLRIASITSAGAGVLNFGGFPYVIGANIAASWSPGFGVQLTHYGAGSNSSVGSYPPPFVGVGSAGASSMGFNSYGKNYKVNSNIADLSSNSWIYQISGFYDTTS